VSNLVIISSLIITVILRNYLYHFKTIDYLRGTIEMLRMVGAHWWLAHTYY